MKKWKISREQGATPSQPNTIQILHRFFITIYFKEKDKVLKLDPKSKIRSKYNKIQIKNREASLTMLQFKIQGSFCFEDFIFRTTKTNFLKTEIKVQWQNPIGISIVRYNWTFQIAKTIKFLEVRNHSKLGAKTTKTLKSSTVTGSRFSVKNQKIKK